MASPTRMHRRASYAYPEPPGIRPISSPVQDEPSGRPTQEGRLSVSSLYGPTGPVSISSNSWQQYPEPQQQRQRAFSSPDQQQYQHFSSSAPAFWPPTEAAVYNSSLMEQYQRPSPMTSVSSGSSPTFSYRDAPMGSPLAHGSHGLSMAGMTGTSPPAAYLPMQAFPPMTRAHSSSATASYGPSLHPAHALQQPVEQPVQEERREGMSVRPSRPRQHSSASQRSTGQRSNASRRSKGEEYRSDSEDDDYDSGEDSEDERQRRRRRRSRRREREKERESQRERTKAYYDEIDDRRPTLGDSVSVAFRHARDFLSSKRS